MYYRSSIITHPTFQRGGSFPDAYKYDETVEPDGDSICGSIVWAHQTMYTAVGLDVDRRSEYILLHQQ